MPAHGIQLKVARVFTHRCFYLFACVLILILAAPLIEPTTTSRVAFNAAHLLVLVAAVAAVGRSRASFNIAGVLAVVVLALQAWALATRNDAHLAQSWGAAVIFYLFVLVYLMQYVFREDVMTADKLYGAAAAFLLLSLLWTYAYLWLQWFVPGSFAAGGSTETTLSFGDLLYFSVTVLTSTGFGDIVPVRPLARSLVMFEQISGVLYLAVLIARLAGVYPPATRRGRR